MRNHRENTEHLVDALIAICDTAIHISLGGPVGELQNYQPIRASSRKKRINS